MRLSTDASAPQAREQNRAYGRFVWDAGRQLSQITGACCTSAPSKVAQLVAGVDRIDDDGQGQYAEPSAGPDLRSAIGRGELAAGDGTSPTPDLTCA